MNILIIGGTKFLGRQLVEAALARGHTVTLFNRGKTNPGLFPQVETVLGDREHDIAKLAGREWDAVIDVAGYIPRIVRLSATGLEGSVSRYVFISSISAYAEEVFKKIGVDEYDPVGIWKDEMDETSPESYGARKAVCEKTVRDLYGNRALIIRPGLIVGPHDPTDRFTYWPVRVARGGEVLTPERPSVPAQIIDVRDLAEFVIKMIEANASGIYNATGPDYELTFGTMLETCKRVSGSDASFRWASAEFLKAHNIVEWSDMPVWVPDNEENRGFSRVDVSKAIQAGLTFRALEETVRDTLAWAKMRPADHEWRAGMTQEKEDEALAALKGD
jgi:2'-hydroxyisoflavone reductase